MGLFNEIDYYGEIVFVVIFKNVMYLKEKEDLFLEVKDMFEEEVKVCMV